MFAPPPARKSAGARWLSQSSPWSCSRMHWDHELNNAVGARLCEPQRVGILKMHGLTEAAGLAKLLRVADPRSGARLCEAQHCPQFSRCPRPIRALAAGNTAAGRRPALRDGRFMESPDAIFSAHWDHEPDLHESLNDE